MKKVFSIITAIILLITATILLTCSDDPSSPEETISRPSTPTGADETTPNESKTYTTGGAVSNLGHAVAYRFDLDAAGSHNFTAWCLFDTVAASWPDSGVYVVKAQARCAEHTSRISEWSDGKQVAVATEIVSTPGLPSGPTDIWTDSLVTYCTGVSTSSKSHTVEYQFDWDAAGARDTTVWDTTICLTHTWASAGFYEVKTRARCAADTNVVSDWSPGKTVAVAVENITTPNQPGGATHTWPYVPRTLCTGGAVSNWGHSLEYQFDWDAAGVGDTTVWGTTTCLSHAWPAAGTYEVKARARCATHTGNVSLWSSSATISVTEVTQLPTIHFATHINGVHKPYDPVAIPDTVGMFKPFSMSYHGTTVNGSVQEYKFFPLTPGVILPGANLWTSDLQDTLRAFSNKGADALPSGVFRLAAQCRDEALAESPIDAGSFTEGVCQVVVNFDPDTKILEARNSYVVNSVNHVRSINFADGIPDTVPFRSWVRLFYRGWDDPRDSLWCSPIDPDRCIDFQVRYMLERHNDEIDVNETSSWLPYGDVHNTDLYSAADSNTFSIGSFEYELLVRSIDEQARPDGTPPSVSIAGNFDPTMDSVVVEDHLGHRLNLAVVDTVEWNFWKGEGWPYTSFTDTFDVGQNMYYKTFSFHVKGWGHDHPWELTGSGVKSWRYTIKNSSGGDVNLGHAGAGFFDGAAVDVLDDRVHVTFYYLDPSEIFNNLPSWFNDDLTITLVGRDTGVSEPAYNQYVFLNGVKTLVNVLNPARMGRYTEESVFTFQVRLTQ